ncbi:Hypothetical protein SRAE_2000056800 [Strongyloides ratti]|uniref:Uncharacterized protein n=1 Tax=Strongyloides ratti TaxID=34506 RepID=A0A090LCP7_STRRB|nr:Hypothetical protein SRAE_2000056800 [Strongyloides ratti]CEF65893.1 Hypothetical protein SRAE_2000056800 [Strongyloides ratti]
MSKLSVIFYIISFFILVYYSKSCEGRDLRNTECDCRCDENGNVIGGTECENLINNEENNNEEINNEEDNSNQLSTDLAISNDNESEIEILKRDKRYYGCGCCGCCMMGTPKTVTKTIKVTYGGCCGCGGYGYG